MQSAGDLLARGSRGGRRGQRVRPLVRGARVHAVAAALTALLTAADPTALRYVRVRWPAARVPTRSADDGRAGADDDCSRRHRFVRGGLRLEPLAERREQHRHVDRLGDVIVHPGLEAALALAGHRVRGHRDHWRHGIAPVAPDLARGLESVHHRHLAVHQHRIVG